MSFISHVENKTVSVLIDNATAVAYVNHMGGCHSAELNNLARQLWLWCIQHGVWIIARHIPGIHNTSADFLSRNFSDHLEWKLDPGIVCNILTKFNVTPSVDLFASRLNYQFKPFVSWHPDPEAKASDAFSISWANDLIYAFPPFAVIDRTLQKIEIDEATGILIFPLWKTQHWFPRLLRLLITHPVMLPKSRQLLFLPHAPLQHHPLEGQMIICAALLSGKPSSQGAFQQVLLTSSSTHGNKAHRDSILYHLPNGCTSVLNGRWIQFKHL